MSKVSCSQVASFETAFPSDMWHDQRANPDTAMHFALNLATYMMNTEHHALCMSASETDLKGVSVSSPAQSTGRYFCQKDPILMEFFFPSQDI